MKIKMMENILAANFHVSCKTGEGLDAWLDWLREQVYQPRAKTLA
jgi:hypothetical protein